MKSYGVTPPQEEAATSNPAAAGGFLLLVPFYSCIVTSFASPQGAFRSEFFCSLKAEYVSSFFYFFLFLAVRWDLLKLH